MSALKSLYINLVVALVTFGIGIAVGSTWFSSRSVDNALLIHFV